MRILHTADWHLGNIFYGHDRTVEHRHFLQWLLDTLRQQLPDVLVISGNVFDSENPSTTAEQLFFDFLQEATESVRDLQIVITSGNRDSSGRLEAAAKLLRQHNICVRGKVSYIDEGKVDFENFILPLRCRYHTQAELVCFAIPYLRANDYPRGMTLSEGVRYYFENIMRQYRKSEYRKLPVMAVTHFNVTGADISETEKREWWVVGGQESVRPEMVGEGLAYVALGNVHRGQCVEGSAGNLYYAGSILPMSFDEKNFQHGVLMVEISTGGYAHVERLFYKPLRQLQNVPEEGFATVKEIYDAICALPKRKKGESGDEWPYLEIRMQVQDDDPVLMHEINGALMDRAVHYCHMVREWPVKPLLENPAHHRTLQTLTPLEIAKSIFKSRYQEEMPEELVTRFKKAEQYHQDASAL